MWSKKNNWIHFTGVAGIVTGQLAAAYERKGYIVTGSDQGIYEPMKSFLATKTGIKIKNNYSYKNLLWQTYSREESEEYIIPSKVIAAGGLSRKNKELVFARKHSIPIYNFAEILAEELIVENYSIVVAGSFGKTTTTAMLVNILLEAGKEISYMFGGIVENIEYSLKLKNEATEMSVIEGDEYISSRTDTKSKFFHYKPKYLLLTGYAYDHTDVFTTTNDYYLNFEKLIEKLPEDGKLVINGKYEQLVKLAEKAACQVIVYDKEGQKNLPSLNVIGDFNRENALAAATMAKALSISDDKISSALASFPGVHRRLQIKKAASREAHLSPVLVIDDFGSTPGKAKAAIDAVRDDYPQSNLIVAFEPNIGARTVSALSEFEHVFSKSDSLVLLPFTEIKQKGIVSQERFAQYLEGKVEKLILVDDTREFEDAVSDQLEDRENIILFLSSHDIDKYLQVLVK
jgi:UDP-N-acetylmuramate: L-alanyl-gamma-D-glutamyl-meso-diaminopimelate ligase